MQRIETPSMKRQINVDCILSMRQRSHQTWQQCRDAYRTALTESMTLLSAAINPRQTELFARSQMFFVFLPFEQN